MTTNSDRETLSHNLVSINLWEDIKVWEQVSNHSIRTKGVMGSNKGKIINIMAPIKDKFIDKEIVKATEKEIEDMKHMEIITINNNKDINSLNPKMIKDKFLGKKRIGLWSVNCGLVVFLK